MLSPTAALLAILKKFGYAVTSTMNAQALLDKAATQVAADAIPSPGFWIVQSFADAATGDTTITAPVPAACRVIDFIFENRGANGANANTVQLCAAAAGASPISDALSTNGKVATDIVRAAKIDVATAVLAANANLYIRRTRAGGALNGEARIHCVPV